MITDCTEAIELNPKNIKAYWRASLACIKIDSFREAIAWCDKGLLIDPSNKNLSDDRIRSVKAAAAKEKKIRMDANKGRKATKLTEDLRKAFEVSIRPRKITDRSLCYSLICVRATTTAAPLAVY